MTAKMTAKQAAFVLEYLVDLNATQAYIRAGFKARGNAASVEGHRLLRNPKVQSAIAAAQQERAKRTTITADRVLQEVARLAFFDPRRLLNADGTAKPVHELDDDTAAAVAGLELSEITAGETVIGTVKKYKIADKNTALTNAMRHLGMLRDKLEIEASVRGSVAYKANIPARKP